MECPGIFAGHRRILCILKATAQRSARLLTLSTATMLETCFQGYDLELRPDWQRRVGPQHLETLQDQYGTGSQGLLCGRL